MAESSNSLIKPLNSPQYEDVWNTKNDPKLREQAKARLRFAQAEGKKIFGVDPSCSPARVPDWYDPVAFKHGQQLRQTYRAIISFSEFYGLMFALNNFEGLMPLLMTGVNRTVSLLFSRYISTTLHVNNWFAYDPFDPNSRCYRSLKIVRGLHLQVGRKLNSTTKVNHPEYEETDLWMSQFSIMGAQFTFLGMMAIFPRELGFHRFTKYDFHCIFHCWRVIAYCLGAEDRFNLCSGSDEETVEMCRLIWEEYNLPKMRVEEEKTGMAMARGIAHAMGQLSPVINYNALMHYAAPFVGLDQRKYPVELFMDKVYYYVLYCTFHFLSRFLIFNWLMSQLARVRLWLAVTYHEYHEEHLEKKFNYSYDLDERCPFAVKVNYDYAFKPELKLY